MSNLKTIRRTVSDLGQFVTRKKTTPASVKLESHSRTQHEGRILPECPACCELVQKSMSEGTDAE